MESPKSSASVQPKNSQYFNYNRPKAFNTGKAVVNLGRSDHLRGAVQVIKKGAGDNNLHIHTGMDGFYMVLKGEVTFYGHANDVIGIFGANQGLTMPHGNAYWFASTGDVDLEILQVVTWAPDIKDERLDLEDQKEGVGPGKGEFFDARVR